MLILNQTHYKISGESRISQKARHEPRRGCRPIIRPIGPETAPRTSRCVIDKLCFLLVTHLIFEIKMLTTKMALILGTLALQNGLRHPNCLIFRP